MTKKMFYIILFLCFAYCCGFSQVIVNDSTNNNEKINNSEEISIKNDIKKNTIYFESAGNGILYSIGYDRIIFKKDKHGFSIATGISYYSSGLVDLGYLISPQINYFSGYKRKYELGLGYTIQINYDYPMRYRHGTIFRIGYRYQEQETGMFFKAAFTPIIVMESGEKTFLVPWFGITIGKSF